MQPGDRRAVGDEAKLLNSEEIWRSSSPAEDRRHAILEHRSERLTAVGVDALQVFGRQLSG